MIITVFPGQGSQTPGFLEPWLELDGARDLLDAYASDAEVDLVAAGTRWDADRIRDTDIAQPLIVAASLLSYGALRAAAGDAPDGVAGHSVGEIAALVAAEVIPAEIGMRLVGLRGRAMAQAAALQQTGMSAVLGGDRDAVLALLDELALTPANHNGAGQIVAAGALDALSELSAHPVAGSRVIPLQVAGAFHTSYMAPAVDALRAAAADVSASAPTVALWTNRDGSRVTDGRVALDLLVDQVSSPVRWDLCMESFADAGVTGIIELAPAGTLTGLAKRALRGVPTVAVKTPDDLAAAAALLTGGDA
ncbi:ACP S-malonyltransferase [Microbacterium sp. VKM Ac-2870]|uniref:ACP S-malonyltransferase n=1 Tax=Microbacterium sp. VKM Ac-2870 TaxID=2783825 RepID=UPI00188B5B6F|nr:ACP S-malonyltransferase [Microbacterium sp. VKM Ac-2870]MBF4560850.1 ACP S-malonyltransferase [Microbacterium sp. VKM Ac-2870]